jgi:hypothetical protein
MLPFGVTIFWSAFLLFLVQPLIAKYILPWFGGSAAVWTTCMLFFQAVLLAGYAGAHLLVSKLAPRRQVIVYLCALGVALICLPIQPSDAWKPADGSMPAGRILLLLAATLGLPYLVLSSTGPLMQSWFSRAYADISPYRLYAVSNVGSLLALVSYPVFFERYLSRGAQAMLWSCGLGLFALLAAICGTIVWQRGSGPLPPPVISDEDERREHPRWLWFALPACASILLLAVTNKICQDVAVIPFLWVAPLVVYLLSFIISFDSPRWYLRSFWGPLFLLAMAAVLWVMLSPDFSRPMREQPWPSWVVWLDWLRRTGDNLPMVWKIAVYVGALFVLCMVCHGETYRLRPEPRRLSGYYLFISAGGAFGGFTVAVLAPLVFHDFIEFHIALVLAAILFATVLSGDPASPLFRGRPRWAFALICAAVVGVAWGARHDAKFRTLGALEMSRSFFGVLKVYEDSPESTERHKLVLQHGGTDHGLQFVDPEKRMIPSSYYVRNSGVGRAMRALENPQGRRVGMVGLGTGTLASYGEPGDFFRFFEIDRNVHRLATSRFTYLRDCQAHVEVSFGDARLSMERENDAPYDLLVLDAFSSDAIPVHLLTREAFEIYLKRLKPSGIIAVHVSNRYLSLPPVVFSVADRFGLKWAFIGLDATIAVDEDEQAAYYNSDWILVSRDPEILKKPIIADAATDPRAELPKADMWTDDLSNLLPILKLND